MLRNTFVFLLFMIFASEIDAHKKVLLGDVNTITLRKGEYTTGRRSSPVPQLKCVGGSAAGRFSPRVAQCTRTGHDGVDYQWKCSADMPQEYEFGRISVTCEGFDYPDDPYVLHGSCGLEYDLEFSDKRHSNKHSTSFGFEPNSLGITIEKIVTYAVYAFFTFIAVLVISDLYTKFTGNGGDGAAPRGGGGGGPGYPGGGPGFGPPPPPYDDHRNFPKSSPPHQANDGPGFWTGAGLGALGGYFMGRNQGGGGGHRDGFASARAYERRDRTPSPSPSTSATHTSTSYGGTRRR